MKFPHGHHKAAKLTGVQVLRIRELYSVGYSQGALARDYQVSVGTIGRIVRGESWQAVTEGSPVASPGALDSEAELSARRLVEQLRAGQPATLDDQPGHGHGSLPKCPHPGGLDVQSCPECLATMAKFGLGGGK